MSWKSFGERGGKGVEGRGKGWIILGEGKRVDVFEGAALIP